MWRLLKGESELRDKAPEEMSHEEYGRWRQGKKEEE
jgi:hypothetical protein